jgi:hypothetical protein
MHVYGGRVTNPHPESQAICVYFVVGSDEMFFTTNASVCPSVTVTDELNVQFVVPLLPMFEHTAVVSTVDRSGSKVVEFTGHTSIWRSPAAMPPVPFWQWSDAPVIVRAGNVQT